jgi:large subunit ribosomal protein L29
MALIKKRAIHEMEITELNKRLSELRLELVKDRAQSSVGAAPANTGRVKERRRTIARILTELKLRSLKTKQGV